MPRTRQPYRLALLFYLICYQDHSWYQKVHCLPSCCVCCKICYCYPQLFLLKLDHYLSTCATIAHYCSHYTPHSYSCSGSFSCSYPLTRNRKPHELESPKCRKGAGCRTRWSRLSRPGPSSARKGRLSEFLKGFLKGLLEGFHWGEGFRAIYRGSGMGFRIWGLGFGFVGFGA